MIKYPFKDIKFKVGIEHPIIATHRGHSIAKLSVIVSGAEGLGVLSHIMF